MWPEIERPLLQEWNSGLIRCGKDHVPIWKPLRVGQALRGATIAHLYHTIARPGGI